MHVYDLILLDSTANLRSEYILGLLWKLIVMVNLLPVCITVMYCTCTCWVAEQLPELPSRWRYLSTYLKYSALYCVTPEYESRALLHFSFSLCNSALKPQILTFVFVSWIQVSLLHFNHSGVMLHPSHYGRSPLTLFDPFNINSTWLSKVVQQQVHLIFIGVLLMYFFVVYILKLIMPSNKKHTYL